MTNNRKSNSNPASKVRRIIDHKEGVFSDKTGPRIGVSLTILRTLFLLSLSPINHLHSGSSFFVSPPCLPKVHSSHDLRYTSPLLNLLGEGL